MLAIAFSHANFQFKRVPLAPWHVGCLTSWLCFTHHVRERPEGCGKMKRRNLKRGFRVQRLEDRRLLAADFAVIELAPVEISEPEMCQVAELEVQSDVEDQAEVLDLDSTEFPVDVIDGDEADLQPVVEAEAEVETGTEDVVEVEVDVESPAHDLGDPVDGTDGFFGSIDAENPSQSFTITPSEAGMIDIVVASSFGDSETRMDVTNSNGGVVASTMAEELSGFQMLSFEAEAGETYQLDVSSEDGGEGLFQVTVEHNEIAEPVDLHADSIGEDSTEILFNDGASELGGELELAGDIDTFRFTADSNGKISLGLAELNAENATELQVQVFDGAGEAITRGVTNETVGISFDVECDGEYFLAVSAGENQTGSYQLDMNLEADVVEAEPEVVVDQPVDDVVVDEVVDATTELELAAESQDTATDASVEVLGSDSTPVVEGATNDDVGVLFDIVEGDSYQVRVDSINDIPATYELTLSLTETEASPVVDSVDEVETTDDTEPVEDLVVVDPVDESSELGDVAEGDSIDDLIDEELEVCFTDLEGENDEVDSFFAEFNPDSIFTMDNGFELRRRS